MTPYASLFSSIELAGRRLRNRIVHPSMTTVTGADGRATDRLILLIDKSNESAIANRMFGGGKNNG